ncbi:MAG: hypothetical protein Q8K02_10555 [Flavobacterium sp.]|nr:hypothetical protein [Flavobacterium sp.]
MYYKKISGFLNQVFVTQTHGYIDISQKQDFWKLMGDDLNVNLKISHNSGNELKSLCICIPYKNQVIKITESDTKPLKFEVDFVYKLDSELTVGSVGKVGRFLYHFSGKTIETGITKFDDQYLIESKDKSMTICLLSNIVIDTMFKHNVYSLSISTNSKKKTSKLISVFGRNIFEMQTMKELVHLHFIIIEKLQELKIIKMDMLNIVHKPETQ